VTRWVADRHCNGVGLYNAPDSFRTTMHPLTTIVCGDAPRAGAIVEVYAHLANSLDRLLVRAVSLRDENDPVDMALFGPLLGRGDY
jgi:hypothetical protein